MTLRVSTLANEKQWRQLENGEFMKASESPISDTTGIYFGKRETVAPTSE